MARLSAGAWMGNVVLVDRPDKSLDIPKAIVASFDFYPAGVRGIEARLDYGSVGQPASESCEYWAVLLTDQQEELLRYGFGDPRFQHVETEQIEPFDKLSATARAFPSGLVQRERTTYTARFPFTPLATTVAILGGRDQVLATLDLESAAIPNFCRRYQADPACRAKPAGP